jgi:hypothetical protein
MSHRFEIMIDGEIQVFDQYKNIPQQFDHVIAFIPEVPPPPHSHEDHEEIEQWSNKFDKLMEIERASSRKTG